MRLKNQARRKIVLRLQTTSSTDVDFQLFTKVTIICNLIVLVSHDVNFILQLLLLKVRQVSLLSKGLDLSILTISKST